VRRFLDSILLVYRLRIIILYCVIQLIIIKHILQFIHSMYLVELKKVMNKEYS
jgi:hypothetical protein